MPVRDHARTIGWAALMALLLALFTVPPNASAASLTQVSGFGSNPGNLSMYSYVPDNLPSGAPLVVALHGCTQSASDYYSHSGWPKYADAYGFALVLPQTSSANNANSCFNWYQSSDYTRGQGEALSVKQMVDYAIAHYGSAPGRVYVTGLSAGGAMTAVMLADYPDVFAGGSIDSGIPAGCATDLSSGLTCEYSPVSKTPQKWGDAVRAASGGWSGPWPRVAVWHGSGDTTVNPANATESRDQWTNVWGMSQTPSSTTSLPGGTTQAVYNDISGKPAVETFTVSGMSHGLAVNPGSGADQCGTTGTYYLNYVCSSYYTAKFWGLDASSGPGSGSLPAPTGLSVTATTDTTASLSWNGVSAAASYNVYRGGTKVASTSSTSYTDTGLASGTGYHYTVAAVDSAGSVGASSSPVLATTNGYIPKCFTDNNYNHVAAGRAHQSGGYAYANGSNQNMGLYNLYLTHTLEETSDGHYVIADSGCPA
ncbi:PHB depolymerase family esterase [Streptomyces sp. NBC_01571]|uniref:extracellular catalytic domain type 1 short-chain-length polyhydroxyalkanoate depolymerase n=1 Tax=Streptomyces sp. NBC_01571 TaxID=2975883 RepID=UPI00224F6D50|nr:PHB depolymerase family esterase [Streptomyces sp. NBC_01571]MCX4572688.1 PHB depolymerase family esterase [Streptomyces sp. NBC_01571]